MLNTPSSTFWNSATYFLAFFAALLMGVLSATGQPLLSIIFAGVLSAIILMTQPVLLLWMVLFMTLLVAGLLVYFGSGLEKVWWVTYGMGAMLFASAAVARATRRTDHVSAGFSPIMPAVFLFLLISLLSTLVNKSPTWQVVLSIKSIFLFGGIWAALAIIPITQDTMKRWLTGFLVIGLAQIVPVLYQYIFVRSTRLSQKLGMVEASDSVVGTFGGSMESGGLTAVLAAFLVMLIIVILAFYRARLLERSKLLLFLLILGIPLLLMEVKVIFIYLPLSLFILYKDVLFHRPASFVGGSIAVVLLMSLVLLGYQFLHWSSTGRSLEDNIKALSSYSFAEKSSSMTAHAEGVMSRRDVISFWWDKHHVKEPLHMFLGHGLGASRTRGLGVGNVAATYYPLHIDKTGIAFLLWDVGLLGAATYLWLIASGYRLARRLSLSPRLEAWERALAQGLQAAVLVFLVSLFYRSDIPYAAPMMFLFMTVFGLLAWLHQQDKGHHETR